jgi:hypothetical protein
MKNKRLFNCLFKKLYLFIFIILIKFYLYTTAWNYVTLVLVGFRCGIERKNAVLLSTHCMQSCGAVFSFVNQVDESYIENGGKSPQCLTRWNSYWALCC